MNAPTRSRADVVALLLIAFMLAALLAPALAASNAQSDKNQCLANMRDIAVALQNNHDTRGYFPLASTQPLDHSPGAAGEKPSGYSWLAMILPFMEQVPLYNYLGDSTVSNKLTVPPFEPAVTVVQDRINGAVMAQSVDGIVCPSFVGGPAIGDDAPEYAMYADNVRPAVTSYHATAGSHFVNTAGVGRMVAPEQVRQGFAYEGNGVMAFPGMVNNLKLVKKGHRIRSIIDGTSKTFVFAESNERNYAAWIDGQVTWLVSAWPSNPDVPTPSKDTNEYGAQVLTWTKEQLPNNQVTPTAQKGVDAKDEPPVYLPGGRWTGSVRRTWGASSNHPEGIGHAFADGHARMLARDIDPVVYLHLTTRNGRELIDRDAVK